MRTSHRMRGTIRFRDPMQLLQVLDRTLSVRQVLTSNITMSRHAGHNV